MYPFQVLLNEIEQRSTLNERIDILLTTTFDLKSEPQPDALLERYMECVYCYEDALKVATLFKTVFKGDAVIICQEASACSGKFVTLLDTVNNSIQSNEVFPGKNHLGYAYTLVAFEASGFKYSHECDQRLLWHLYKYNKDYIQYMFLPDEYHEAAQLHLMIHEELCQVLFHPRRVAKWINLGYDVEDYLG